LRVFDGKNWKVENYTTGEVVVDKTEHGHTVNIYNCKNTSVKILGKVNSVILDKSDKTVVQLESVIGTVSVINSKNCKVQAGRAPMYTVDGCNGVTLYINKNNLDAEIVSAKSEVLIVETETEKEDPIPFQYSTKYINGKWVTHPVEHVGV